MQNSETDRQFNLRQRLLDRSGQSALEFALVVPFVLLLLLGLVDFGQAYNYKNDVTSLANEAARFASVNSCTPCGSKSIEAYVKSNAESRDLQNGGGQIAEPGVQISICFVSGTGQINDALRATATATFNFLPSLLNVVPSLQPSVTLSSTVTQRVEVPYVAGSSKYTASAC
jgi:Flp pilus assembly protein TadG